VLYLTVEQADKDSVTAANNIAWFVIITNKLLDLKWRNETATAFVLKAVAVF